MFSCLKSGHGLLAFAIAVGLAVYLFIWHGEHVAALLPFVVILLCPLSHLFLHRHGSGQHLHNREEKNDNHLTRSAEK